ncbi:MAG: DUF4838 domain-containing protein [Phycisphaerae bacterium]|nr:DUF4838 domain-containing protein [Phycisphaerae bacterium]
MIRPIPSMLCSGLLAVATACLAGGKDPYPRPVGPMHTLAEGGAPRSVVVLGENPSPVEAYAARELVTYVEKVTGARPAMASRPDPGLHPIYLGDAARERGGSSGSESLGSDGFVLKSDAGGVRIVGGTDLGTLYGTYEFIEKHLGVRWFAPDELGEVVPKTPTLQVGTFNETSVPSFRVRWIESGEWALRNKMNVGVEIDGKGVGVNWKWGFHTFFKLIPPEKYYDDHPEWFSMIRGKRRRPKPGQHGLQLCTSNPQLIKEVADNIIKLFDADGSLDIIALAPQDGGGFCECSRCRELDEKRPEDQAWHARYSRRLALFNNAVAKRVAREHPDKLIKVGAYAMYVRVPLDPGYRPERNLAVQVCHTYSCNNHRIEAPTCGRNRALFGEELERWAKLTKHLFIYEYYNKGAWGGLPYYQIHVIREDMPYYHRLGAEGFYTQPAGRRWPAVGLNHYVAAKLAWDVELDVDRLLEDFYVKFYGEASGPMREYWQMLERAFVEADQCLSPFGLKWTSLVATDFFTPGVVGALEQAVAKAEGSARTDAVRKRVHWARTMADFTRMVTAYLHAIRSPFKGVDLKDAKAVGAAHRKAIALGEPLSSELRAFCKRNQIPAYDRLIGAHGSVGLIVPAASQGAILR